MDIEFYPICGFEGLYEWSQQLEVVRSVARMGTNGKVLKWMYDKQGRPYVRLYKNGVARHFYKAMIIYSHTHQCEIPRGYQVHHIDYNKDNNDPSNLQLVTSEEHMKLHEQFQKNNTICSKAVIALDDRGNVVHRFASTKEAERNGFNQGNVSSACRGCYYDCKSDTHLYKGYYWWYEQEWLRLQ